MPSLNNKKEQTLFRLAVAVLSLHMNKGNFGWKVTDVVRRTRISRTLTYRYLGSSKQTMLTNSFCIFSTLALGLNKKHSSETFIEVIISARKIFMAHPELLNLYQKNLFKNASIKEEIEKVEIEFQLLLRKVFPYRNNTQILYIQTLIFGLLSSPFLSENETILVLQHLTKLGMTDIQL